MHIQQGFNSPLNYAPQFAFGLILSVLIWWGGGEAQSSRGGIVSEFTSTALTFCQDDQLQVMDCRGCTGDQARASTKPGRPRDLTAGLGAFFSDQERIDLGIVCPGTALFNLSNYGLKLQKRELEVKMIP